MAKTIEIIAGPTASGKSAIAVAIAKKRDGVIINADSRQMYDALPILSAQPTTADKADVPHEGYGVHHPNNLQSAGTWLMQTLATIETVLARGQTPIVTGGTGLYIKALLEGLSPIPEIPTHIRRAAVEKQAALGNPAFHAALAERDPETAALYHPMHTARLIHAWEILETTGRPFAYWQSLPRKTPPSDWRFDITLVMPDRERLRANCHTRFISMMETGAIEEALEFSERQESGNINPDSPTIKTIGLIPLRNYGRGQLSREDAIERAVTETRQYAKRQNTWFKNQKSAAPNVSVRTIQSITDLNLG